MKIVVCLKQVPDMESKFKIIDDSKIDELGCKGAPDLIVEILSPGNSKKKCV